MENNGRNRNYYLAKSQSRIQLNIFLLTTAFTIFFIVISINKELLFYKIFLIQLIFSIPLLLTSILAYAKIAYREKIKRWDKLGWISFIIGYAFLLNSIGILVGNIISTIISLIFFSVSWALTIIYSLVDISYEKNTWKERITKDSFFILLQVIFGVLPVLKII